MDTRRRFIGKTAVGGIAGVLAYGAAPAFVKGVALRKKEVSLEEAQALHKKMLIIDGHNDTPVERVARKEFPFRWKERDPTYHTDIPKMHEGGYDCGFMIVGNGPTANIWITTESTLRQVELFPDDLMLVLTSKDAVTAGKTGRIGIMLSIEGAGRWLEGKVELLRVYHRLGFRLVGITHGEGGSEPGQLQGSRSLYVLCKMEDREADRKNGKGLTPFGFEVLKAENELGIVTDLSHINDRAFYDVIEHSTLPPIMSHTAVFAQCPHARCMTDDQIRALAAKGGVMGVAFAPMFIDTDAAKATVDRVVEHIIHVRDLVGIDYVGIGTDYDGLGKTVPVVPDVSQLATLTRSMMAHGLTESEIRKVWGENFLRVLKTVIDKKTQKIAIG